MSGNGELQEAIEANDSGAIFIAKPSSSPPRSKRALASADSLALDPEKNVNPDCCVGDYDDASDLKKEYQGDDDSATQEDDVVSLELLTVVGDEPEKNRLQQLCSKRMIWCWLCGLLLLILAIVLPLTLRKKDRSTVSTEDSGGIDFVSDGSVTTPAYDVLVPIVAKPENLLDPNTAEGQAYLAVRKEDDDFDIQQNYALQMLYFSTDGDAWVFNHGWEAYSKPTRSSEQLCGWASVTRCRNVGDGKMAVAGLDLDSNNLRGEIPVDLCLLNDLETMRLANNHLEGTLPSCLASQPTLEILEVEGNTELADDAV
ncbi:MAG: hypothetical protein SGILL_010555, partial [Bacillariaceae sp.]